jgi:very-short-patch-repair endonuclease
MRKPVVPENRVRQTTPEIVEAARLLRQRQTDAEVRLWEALRGKRAFPHRVRRQHAYGPYVLDFWIPAVRVAIELDGTVHNQPEIAAQDRERAAWFEAQDVVLLRFRNGDVFSNLNQVLNAIRRAVAQRSTK